MYLKASKRHPLEGPGIGFNCVQMDIVLEIVKGHGIPRLPRPYRYFSKTL